MTGCARYAEWVKTCSSLPEKALCPVEARCQVTCLRLAGGDRSLGNACLPSLRVSKIAIHNLFKTAVIVLPKLLSPQLALVKIKPFICMVSFSLPLTDLKTFLKQKATFHLQIQLGFSLIFGLTNHGHHCKLIKLGNQLTYKHYLIQIGNYSDREMAC
jgi:hypothetical protein